MRAFNVATLRWHLMQWLKWLSLPTMVSVVLLTICVSLYLLRILPMLAQTDKNLVQTQALITRQSHIKTQEKVNKPSVIEHTIQDKIALFYERFPTANTLPDWLEKINAEAESHRLTLDKGDYKLKILKSKYQTNGSQNPELIPYEITLPIQGDYENIRMFINELLASLPMLAITDVQMQRDRINSNQIEARLRLVLFFSDQSNGAF